MKVQPIAAFCAVGPSGLLDIDMVRRSHAAAQWAAGAVTGTPWPRLAAGGWSVIAVCIGPAGDGAGDGAAEPARKATLPPDVRRTPSPGAPRPAPVAAPRAARPPPPAPAAAGGRMTLLRAGALP